MEIKQFPVLGAQKFGVIYKQRVGAEGASDVAYSAVKLSLIQRIRIRIKLLISKILTVYERITKR